jgi:hypothetical protein
MSWFYPPWNLDEAAAAFVAEPIRVTLAPSRVRRANSSILRKPLRPRPQASFGPGVYLTRYRYDERRKARSAYIRPTVVRAAEAPLGGVMTQFARLRPQPTTTFLRPPAVLAAAQTFSGPQTSLVRIRPARTLAALFGVIGPEPVIDFGPGRYLTRFIPPPPTMSRLSPPTVLAVEAAFYGPAVTLAPSSRGRPQSFLREPVVLQGARTDLGPSTVLVRIRPQPTTTRLSPPTVVRQFFARPIDVTLARIRPPATRYFLNPPTDLVDLLDQGRVETTLVRIRPPATRYFLGPPTDVVDLLDQGRVETTLARIRPVPTRYFLRPPTDTKGLEDQGEVKVTLAPQRRGKPLSFFIRPAVHPRPDTASGMIATQFARIRPQPTTTRLSPPTTTEEARAYFGPSVTLAPSSRGKPISFLRPEVAVQGGRIDLGPSVVLVRIRPPATLSFLRPPAVVAAAEVYYGPAVSLTRIRPPATRWFLKPPTVVTPAALADAVIDVTLVRIRPVPTQSELRPPAVVAPFIARPTDVTLAPQRRGEPTSFLRPPAVVREADRFFGPEVMLAPQSRGRPTSFLKPPSVEAIEPHRPILVSLAPSSRGRPIWFLNPPAVDVTPGVELFGPEITLVRIRPVPTRWFLKEPTLVIPICYGDVVGFDFAPVVCGDDEGPIVTGSEEAADVCGDDTAATVDGTTEARGTVSGQDERREGCD